MVPVKRCVWVCSLVFISLGASIAATGRITAAPAKVAAALASRPSTAATLPLKLVGTMVGDTPYTYAIIEDLTTRTQGLYRPGDRLRKVKILEIRRNRVVIDHGGRRETLLSFQDLNGPASLEQPAGQAKKPADGTGTVREEIRQLGDHTWSLTREVLSSQFEHMHQLLRSGRLTPHFNGDQQDGFMLTELVQNSFLERIGLRNGDILKGMDGQRITGLEDALQAYQQLLGKPTVQLEVERGGQLERFTYEIR